MGFLEYLFSTITALDKNIVDHMMKVGKALLEFFTQPEIMATIVGVQMAVIFYKLMMQEYDWADGISSFVRMAVMTTIIYGFLFNFDTWVRNSAEYLWNDLGATVSTAVGTPGTTPVEGLTNSFTEMSKKMEKLSIHPSQLEPIKPKP